MSFSRCLARGFASPFASPFDRALSGRFPDRSTSSSLRAFAESKVSLKSALRRDLLDDSASLSVVTFSGHDDPPCAYREATALLWADTPTVAPVDPDFRFAVSG